MATRTRQSRSDNDLPKITPVHLVDNPRAWAIYGRPGTGKTTLACSFPTPILLLDFNDRGTDSVADVKGVDVADIRRSNQVEAIYWKLNKGWKYNTVIFDTTTQYQSMAMQEITGQRDNAKWGAMSRKQYGELSSRMKTTFEDFRDLPMDVVFLSQERVFNLPDEDEGPDDLITPTIGSRLMPSVADALHAAVNVVGQTYIRNKRTKEEIGRGKFKHKERIQYCLYVGPDPVKITKIRKPKIQVPPSFLIDPTYEDLLEIIEGESSNGKKS